MMPFIGKAPTLRKTQPAKNEGVWATHGLRKKAVKTVFLLSEGAILESAFLGWLGFSQGLGQF